MSEAPDSGKLSQIAERVLGQAAFVFVEPSQSGLSKVEMLRVARIIIGTDEKWMLTFAVEMKLGLELAANLLGVEEGSEEAGKASADAVGEMANILAGALAVEFRGGAGESRIGIPNLSVESGPKLDAALVAAERKANFVTENGSHLVVLLGREGVP